MRSDNTWRLGVVAAVTLLSLWLIWPTLHYFLVVSGKLPVPGKVTKKGVAGSALADEETTESRKWLEDLRKRSIPLGLDLQGGVDVLLAVDVDKTRKAKMDDYAENLRLTFQKESPPIDAMVEVTSGTGEIAITVSKQEHVRSADNILIKFRDDNKIFLDYESGSVKAGQKLSLKANPELLLQDMKQTIDSSLKVIRERVDKLGVTQPVVIPQGQDRIRVQIPGEKDPKEVVRTIIRPAKLEFRGVHVDPNNRGPEGRFMDDSFTFIDPKTGKVLPDKQIPPGYEVREMRSVHTDKDTYQQKTEVSHTLVKQTIELTGAMLKDAGVTINPSNIESPVQVSVEFSREGAKRFRDVTKKYVNKPLAILLDGVVYSAPNVRGVIPDGRCTIEGGFTQQEAHHLSLILKAGALPAELVTRQERTVEATLGADSIRSSVMALAVGGALIAVYLVLYYGMAGLIADIAVLINVLLILAFMKLASATLTLSGIGGILLTIGMAVDANVLIYERIREELSNGKNLKTAISLGFNRAFSVIFDANLTTLISGLVLLQFGEGTVKGFALALNVGIVATLFTGLFCTKALVGAWFDYKNKLGVGSFKWFRDKFFFDFIGLRKYAYAWSVGLCLLCVLYVSPLWHGSNWGVDFEGGLLTEVQLKEAKTTQQLQGDFRNWRVQKIAGENRYMIRTKLVDSSQEQLPKTQAVVTKQLDQIVGAGHYSVVGSEGVGNEVGREFTKMAVIACILASIFILIYVWFRFEWTFGCAAVVALFHDLLITYGIYNLLGTYTLAGEVTLDVVSALLVVLGYSVNDTIIVFDRIRENLRLHPGTPFRDLVNHSVCETLNRTVMTVTTTLGVLVVMLLIGGAGLYDFALVLLIGIIKGTYSSTFVASPLLYEIHLYQQKKRDGMRKGSGEPKVVQPMMTEKV